jgi:D-serine deaminase-like pyridoxal phosphate-dependent protein
VSEDIFSLTLCPVACTVAMSWDSLGQDHDVCLLS